MEEDIIQEPTMAIQCLTEDMELLDNNSNRLLLEVHSMDNPTEDFSQRMSNQNLSFKLVNDTFFKPILMLLSQIE